MGSNNNTDIALVISSLRGGGAERSAVLLCESWAELGKSVSLITLSDTADDDYVLGQNVNRVALNLESESTGLFSGITANVKRLSLLRNALKACNAKNILGFSGTSNILLILCSLGLSANVVVAERNYPPYSMRGELWPLLRKYLYRMTDCVVVQSSVSKKWISDNTHAKTVAVIHNAIKWPVPAVEPQVDTNSIIAADNKLLLAVGNIHSQKGFDLLLNAVVEPLLTNEQWQLVVAGAGDSSNLQQHAAKLGLTGRVHFVGRIGNVGDWYNRADAFVLSSRYEGFPNALLEAMASGCAVVSFDCLTGPAEMIEHKINGLLVEPENVEELSASIASLMSNDQLRAKLAANAVQVREQFSTGNIVNQWVSVFKNLDWEQ